MMCFFCFCSVSKTKQKNLFLRFVFRYEWFEFVLLPTPANDSTKTSHSKQEDAPSKDLQGQAKPVRTWFSRAPFNGAFAYKWIAFGT